MYYINKIVGWAMSPIGILFLGIGLGVVIRCRCRKVGNLLICGVLVAFWVLACPITTRVIGVPLEGDEREVGSGQWVVDREVDAVVLLGGGIGKHKECGRTELFGAADRAWEAAKRWKRLVGSGQWVVGSGPKIFCTGVGCAEATIPLLKDWGVPAEAIVALEEPRNTEEEARMIAHAIVGSGQWIVGSERKPRVLLVTSAWHMPRARMLFERAGLEVVAAPCDYEMHYAAERPIEIADFFPSADCSALCRNSAAIKEWVARAGYRLLRR